MSLVSPQKISGALDAISSFHNGFGKRCQMSTHVKKLITNYNPANEKLIKNHNKILDIVVDIMQKISGFLDE
jgi:hypothetical protein